MDELIKIAPNGQWTLEKASKAEENAARLKQIEEFMNRQKARDKGGIVPKAAPPQGRPNYPAGMRPADASTMEHKGDPRNYMDPGHVADVKRMVANREDLAGPQVVSRQIISKPEALVRPAESESELQPPTEYYDEEYKDPATGNTMTRRASRPRQGRFHGEGATTRGKVAAQRLGYEDKSTGDFKGRTLQRAQEHIWSWDANNKKWNHIKTNFITGESDANAPKEKQDPEVEAKIARAKEIASARRRMWGPEVEQKPSITPAPAQAVIPSQEQVSQSIRPTIRKQPEVSMKPPLKKP